MGLHVRELADEERAEIRRLSQSRPAAARQVERARIIQLASEGLGVPAIAARLHVAEKVVRLWLERFNVAGLAGLEDRARSGRPATYTPEQIGEVVATALSDPRALGRPFASWTFERLARYLHEAHGLAISRSRVHEVLRRAGLRWRQQETWFGARVDPAFAQQRAAIETLYRAPPAGSVVLDLDEWGPESAKSFRGQRAVDVQARPAQRAKQEVDYGRRGKGYVFGALRPAIGDVLVRDYRRRTLVNWLDFLERVDGWVPAEVERIYAILDNRNVHHADDVLLFLLAHPRWEFVSQPTAAASLNLIEPWWKVLRALAFKGRRFETWEELAAAVHEATAYWNAHRHPFVWGRRRRHRTPRQPGIRLMPKAA